VRDRSKLGVGQDPEQLRKLLVKSSLRPLGVIGIQFLLDLGACAGGFVTAFFISQGPPIPGGFVLEYLGYAIGCYYFLQVLVEGFALGTIATAVFRFNANSAAYLAAVQELAGPKTALSVVNKVQVRVLLHYYRRGTWRVLHLDYTTPCSAGSCEYRQGVPGAE
jgi:hypothetical protein